MVIPQILLILGGCYNLFFALFHLTFWKRFGWKEDLPHLRFVNRQIMQIMNLCLTYLFFTFALISFFFSDELIRLSLGKVLAGAIGIFWLSRAAEQVVFFGYRNGKSNVFTMAFIIGAILYLMPLLL